MSNTATKSLFGSRSYFKTHQGLFVGKSFTEHLLLKIDKIPYRGLEGVTSHVLVRNMYDKEIINEFLGGMEEARKYAFTLDQIATMIDLQPNGEDGYLLDNRNANLFYLLAKEELFGIDVFWTPCHDWHVRAWPLGSQGKMCADSRVFRNITLTI